MGLGTKSQLVSAHYGRMTGHSYKAQITVIRAPKPQGFGTGERGRGTAGDFSIDEGGATGKFWNKRTPLRIDEYSNACDYLECAAPG
jgi:hypothetical protein